MKLLIIGDARDSFLLSFAKNIKLYDSNITVDILNINICPIFDVDSFSKYFDTIFNYYNDNSLIAKIPVVRGVLREIRQRILERKILRATEYESVILFGLWMSSCKIFKRNKLKNSLGVIMGSDYLQSDTRIDKETFFFAISNCSKVLVGNPNIAKQLIDRKIVNKSRIRNVYFGLDPMEKLYASRDLSRESAKKQFGIAPDTLVFTCGYNASSNQQHFEIIEALNEIDNFPANHLIVIPLTYGGTSDYKKTIESLLAKSKFKFLLLKDYLSDDDIVLLRKSTDIFIQVQKTDAFSGSMQENLFCGNIVITGTWLPYQELHRRGISYFSIDNFQQLSTLIEKIIPNVQNILSEIQKDNTPEKFGTAFWSNVIKDWHSFIIEENH